MNGTDVLMRMDIAGFHAFKILTALTWSFLAFFIAAFFINVVFNRMSARFRHAVWMAAFILFAFAVLLMETAGRIGVPQAEMQIIPNYQTAATVEFTARTIEIEHQEQRVETAESRLSILDYPWSLLLLAYVMFAVGFLSIVVLGRLQISGWIKHGTVLTNQRVITVFTRVRKRLGLSRPFVLIESDMLHAPLTVGTIHPIVLMPVDYCETLTDTDLEALALHELSHVKRYDSISLFFVSVMRSLFFFNPLVWYAARQISLLSENACDDAVIDADFVPLDYANMLVRMAKKLPEHAFATELSAGFIFSKHHFLRRVEQILSDRKDRVIHLTKWMLAGCVIAALAVVIFVVAVPVAEIRSADAQTKQAPTVSGENVSVTFKIIDSKTGKPVKDFTLIHTMDNSIAGISDSKGRMQIDNLKPGRTIFFVKANGLGRWWSKESITYKLMHQKNTVIKGITDFDMNIKLISFDISQGMKPVTIETEPAATVEGRVFDPNGAPVPFATVTVAVGKFRDYADDFKIQTDKDGKYNLTLPASNDIEYRMIAHDGGEMEWNKWANGSSKNIRTKPGDRVSGIDITLTKPCELQGTIVDENGNPEAGHEVIIYNYDGFTHLNFSPSAVSDSDGHFTLTHIRPGVNLIITPKIRPNDEILPYVPDGILKEITMSAGQAVENITLVGYGKNGLLKAMKTPPQAVK